MAKNSSGTNSRVAPAFTQSSSPAFGRTRGDTFVESQLVSIEKRAADIKARVREHCLKFEENWVAKQAMHLWKRRAGVDAAHPAPPGVIAKIDPASVMVDARRLVRARATKRISKINTIKALMENAVIRNRPQPSIKAEFTQKAQPQQRIERR